MGRGILQSWIKLVWLGVAIVGTNSNSFGLTMPFQSSSSIARSAEPTYIRPRTTCPDQLEELMPLLLRDLPSYANRVSQRSYIEEFRITENIPGTIIVAGQPEYQPIELASREYIPVQEEDTTRQVFFTTLERQYASEAIVDLQHYYWLFLTQAQDGWRLALLFSSLGDTPSDEPPTPPQDASQGVVAQAIRLWLRDCRAGSIRLQQEDEG